MCSLLYRLYYVFNLFKDLSLFASEDIFSPPSKQIKFNESTPVTTKQKQPTVRTLLTSPVSLKEFRAPRTSTHSLSIRQNIKLALKFSANRAAAQVHSCLYLSSFTIYISDNSKKFLKTITWQF